MATTTMLESRKQDARLPSQRHSGNANKQAAFEANEVLKGIRIRTGHRSLELSDLRLGVLFAFRLANACSQPTKPSRAQHRAAS